MSLQQQLKARGLKISGPKLKKIYRNIKHLYSFAGFAKKQGKHPAIEDMKPLKNAACVTWRGEIIWVGKESRLPKGNLDAREIDLKGQNLFPSFTESHTHMVFGGDRRDEFELKIQGASYEEIAKSGGGIQSTVKHTRKTSVEKLSEIARERLKRFKAQGVTLLEIKSGYGGDFKTEKKTLEVAFGLKGMEIIPTYLCLHGVPKGEKKDEYVRKVLNKDLPKMKDHFSRLDRLDIFVEKNYFDLKDLELLSAKASEFGFGFCAHTDQLSSGGGSLKAAQLGALSVEHAVHVSTDEIRKLKQYNTIINLLPAADFYIKSTYPNARKFIDAGLAVSLATDFNPGSSPMQDLGFVGVLARRELKMTLPEVWCAYTLNASRALGVFNKGALIPGFRSQMFSSEGEPSDFFYEVGGHPVNRVFGT